MVDTVETWKTCGGETSLPAKEDFTEVRVEKVSAGVTSSSGVRETSTAGKEAEVSVCECRGETLTRGGGHTLTGGGGEESFVVGGGRGGGVTALSGGGGGGVTAFSGGGEGITIWMDGGRGVTFLGGEGET